MMSLTNRLACKGTRQDMEHEKESVHNVLAIAQKAIILVAKKVENNILCVITAPVIMLQPTTLQDPMANPPHTLLKVPNAFVIK